MCGYLLDAGPGFGGLELLDFLWREISFFPGAGIFGKNLNGVAAIPAGGIQRPVESPGNGKMGTQDRRSDIA
jgi:hypothetical protein